MNDMGVLLSEYRRYSELLRGRLGAVRWMGIESESLKAVQVERGIVYAQAITDPRQYEPQSVDRLIEIASSPRLADMAVIDRTGHHRPIYRALLVYSWLRAFGLMYEILPRSEFGRWEEGLRPWCDLLESDLGEIDWPTGAMPAGRGATATQAAWIALALHAAGKIYIRDAWTDLAGDVFGKLSHAQNPDGSFLLAGVSDNPESHWFHELVLLHAASSYAVQAEDKLVAAAVLKNTRFQQQQVQPDHATTQPWGLFAFVWNPRTRDFAGQMLHAATITDSTISLMLLADALYCLELFLK
ncbi:MAG TPA: hypothetical protein VHD56_17820 [Tepidisphaeraceae bacterium]|nr:hypothetical protein [Tepidisphaeraceae bacterium]